jgi:PAS domain S-box-containing protein
MKVCIARSARNELLEQGGRVTVQLTESSGESVGPAPVNGIDSLWDGRSSLLTWLLVALVGCAYFAAARFGLTLAFSTRQVSAIWPPTGIALVGLLSLGYRAWPAIYAGAFLVNAMANEPLGAALWIAAGNTGAALLGTYILRALRFESGLKRSRDVVSLFVAAVGSTLISATLGTASLVAESLVGWSDYVAVWWVWWTGDSLGILVVAPVLLTWIDRPRIQWRGARLIEVAAYLIVTGLVGLIVFVLPAGSSPLFYPRAYVSFPLIAWAGLRFGSRETALGVAAIALFAVWGSVHGHGPFANGLLDTRLILLDAFIATVGCTALLIAAVTAERQGAREAARESESLLKEIIGYTPAMIYVKDLQGRYVMVNRRYEQLWNMPGEIVRGKSDFEVFPAREAERFQAMDRRVIRAGHALTEEEVAAREDGPHTYISVKFPLRNDAGETYAVGGISTDITELHRAQAQLREAYSALEARVRERTAELAAAVESLGQRNKEKETLLREIHHRVKNNLQVVCSLLNLQMQGRTEPDLIAFVQDCTARVRSMALVHEHLYQSDNLQNVPLAIYMRALIDGVRQTQPAPGKVECHVDVADIVLPVDQAIPCGLIVNELMTNALKHGFPDARAGRVSVAIAESDAGIELSVRDDGIGMPEQAAGLQSEGFGLSLVSMLVDQLHGTLEILGDRGTHVCLKFARRG